MFATEVTDGLLGSFKFNENGDPEDASGAVVGFTIYVATDKLETVEVDLAEPGGRRRRPAPPSGTSAHVGDKAAGGHCPPAAFRV